MLKVQKSTKIPKADKEKERYKQGKTGSNKKTISSPQEKAKME